MVNILIQALVTSVITILLYMVVLNVLAWLRLRRFKQAILEIDIEAELGEFNIKTDSKKSRKVH